MSESYVEEESKKDSKDEERTRAAKRIGANDEVIKAIAAESMGVDFEEFGEDSDDGERPD